MVIKCNGYKFMAQNLYSLQFMVCLNFADSAVPSEPVPNRCPPHSNGPKNVKDRSYEHNAVFARSFEQISSHEQSYGRHSRGPVGVCEIDS